MELDAVVPPPVLLPDLWKHYEAAKAEGNV